MKKIFGLLTLVLALFSCDPMEDIYTDLGIDQPSLVENLTYTLTVADYAAISDLAKKVDTIPSSSVSAVKKDTALNADVTSAFIPDIISKLLFIHDQGSSVEVTYTYNNGTDKEIRTEKFVRTAEKWVFDPTVFYVLTKPDYQLMVEDTKENRPHYLDKRNGNNTEWWYGASSYYSNLTMDVQKRRRETNDPDKTLEGLTDAQAEKVIFDRVLDGCVIILEHNYPQAQPEMNGVKVFYNVEFLAFTTTKVPYIATFEVKETGKFVYVEGSMKAL